MDVVDARTLLQTPDTSNSSAIFPWLRYPGGLPIPSDKIDSSNGLFFQQLYAFSLIGKRTPVSAAQRKQKQDHDAFLTLLHTYVTGNYNQDQRSKHVLNGPRGSGGRPISAYGTSTRDRSLKQAIDPSSLVQTEHDPSSFSDSGSDSSLDGSLTYPTQSSLNSERGKPQRIPAPSSPVQVPMIPSPSIPRPQNALDGMENIFDVVFKQQAIGMKLGADETKQFAIVKECFEGSEAKRYPEIQSGVVILAVNGQEVSGLGLSRVLYRLREAPRPVVVRFGRISTRQLLERRKGRGPW